MAKWCHCRTDERGIPWLHHRAAGCTDVVVGVRIERTEGQNPRHLGTNPPVDNVSTRRTALPYYDVEGNVIHGTRTVVQNDPNDLDAMCDHLDRMDMADIEEADED